ncbi:amidase family protein, partial [Fusarium austroafricanum]
MSDLDFLTATAADLLKALETDSVTSEGLVLQYIDRINKYNGYLHAVISVAPKDVILPIARRLDNERKDGKIRVLCTEFRSSSRTTLPLIPALGWKQRLALMLWSDRKSEGLLLSLRKYGNGAHQLQNSGVIILGKGNLSELSNYRGIRMPCGWSAVGGLTQSPFVVG